MNIGGYQINSDFLVFKDWSLDNLLDEGSNLVNMLVGASIVIAVVMVIVAGYTLITASGNPEKIEKGQKTLAAAIIGFILVMIVTVIIRFVLETVGA